MTFFYADIHSYEGVATIHNFTDAGSRPFSLCCFDGHGSLTFNLIDGRDQTRRLHPRLAAELSHTLDHFARHHTLPLRHVPDPEYHI